MAAAGLSAATITAVGGAIEVGVVAYAASDTGKTAVDVKADLDAGRLDAAANKVGFLNALREVLDDVGRQLHADARHGRDLLGGGLAQFLDAAEGL